MIRHIVWPLMISCLMVSGLINHFEQVNAQEEVIEIEQANKANQDFINIHEQIILATNATEGSSTADISFDELSFDEIIEYNEGNQQMLSLLYDDETTEIILYFIDDRITYLGWTNYESNSNPIGEGYIGDSSELSALIKKVDDHDGRELEIDSGNKQVYFDYNTELVNSQLHTFAFLIDEADLEIDIAINPADMSSTNLTESKEESIEEASLNYAELVEDPAWLVEETNQPPSVLIEAYERVKSGGELELEEPEDSNDIRDIYLGKTDDLFVKLEVTKESPNLITLNHYTPDIYLSFPEDIDTGKTYTAEELVNILGPVTIKQLDLEHLTERYAWIRLANEEPSKVLNAFPDPNSNGEYRVKYNEIEE